jgi:hypothetical protein
MQDLVVPWSNPAPFCPRIFVDYEEREIADNNARKCLLPVTRSPIRLFDRLPSLKKHTSADNLANTNLWFIPPGFTRELQPLGRFVFETMKARRRGLNRTHSD